jgi:hypothetical protein
MDRIPLFAAAKRGILFKVQFALTEEKCRAVG